jgi:anti-sigma regulatory factor (Ser/Thr protein kinase)
MDMMYPTAPSDEAFHFRVVCPVEKTLLHMLRRFVATVADEMGFAEEDVMKIEISVDEACSNIARHAYPGEVHGRPQLELDLRPDAEGLTVRVHDSGQGGDASQFRGAADFEDYRRGDRARYDGLGLLIIREFMDEVGIDTRPGGGTTVTMRKFLRGAGEADAVPAAKG